MASAAEAPIAASPAADDLDFDVDGLLQSFSYDDLFDLDADIWIPEPPPPPSTTAEEEKSSDSPSPESGGSCDTVKSYVSHLEKVLMEEEEEDSAAVKESCDIDDFVACLFAEGSRDGGSETSTPESEEEVPREGKEDKQVEEMPATVSADGEDDDPVSKKLRRQMRNRDSAMQSRERKKIYVKELEMKSKYLEAECRRLDYALRCCAAENLSLRQCLQKEKLFDASAAKQESAVLFEDITALVKEYKCNLILQVGGSEADTSAAIIKPKLFRNSISGVCDFAAMLETLKFIPNSLFNVFIVQNPLIIPAAGFPALARQHHLPIPSSSSSQPESKGHRQSRKRPRPRNCSNRKSNN